MSTLWDWVFANKEWIFSGVGAVAIGIFFSSKSGSSKTIKSGDNSTNIQADRDANVTIGKKHDD